MAKYFQYLILAITFIVGYLTWLIFSTPTVDKIKGCIVTKHYKVNLCPKSKNYVSLNHISPILKNLVLVAEDAGFYDHRGFDWDELKKSLQTNLGEKKFARGGSTITQQLAKNVFLNFDKSMSRKIREALLATQIEKILSKNEILEKYLNVIEFAPRIYGIGPASFHFFNKPPGDLNLLEAAYLVYLIPNPKVHSRSFSQNKLTPYARYRVLDLSYRLYRYKKISHSQYLAAKEAVDLFPWNNLDGYSLSAIAGTITVNGDAPTPTSAAPAELAPETADAPIAVEAEAEEPEYVENHDDVPTVEAPETEPAADSPFEP